MSKITFEICPNKDQEEKLIQTLFWCRWLYNHFLKHILKESKKGIKVTRFDLNKYITSLKKWKLPLKEIYTRTLQDVSRRVNYNTNKNDLKRKSKEEYNSFSYQQRGVKLIPGSIKLSKIGSIKTKDRIRLKNRIEFCTVERIDGKWFATLMFRGRPKFYPERPIKIILMKGNIKNIRKSLKGFIGSGKISREFLVPNRKKKRKFLNGEMKDMMVKRLNIIPGPVMKKKTTNPIKFSTASSKLCFNYWNSLGYPFVRHQPLLSKTTVRGLYLLDKAIKKDGKGSVISAMDVAKSTFNAKWFKMRLQVGKKKISLPNFFNYTQNDYNKAKRFTTDLPRSWYKEFLKGQKYIERKYSIAVKDPQPDITEKLIEIWNTYDYSRRESLSEKQINQFRYCTKILLEFSKLNEVDPLNVLDIIDGMINKFHLYKPKHIGYLTSSIFWNEIVPKEFVRYYGIADHKKDWIRVL